jgi:hypothetical protein
VLGQANSPIAHQFNRSRCCLSHVPLIKPTRFCAILAWLLLFTFVRQTEAQLLNFTFSFSGEPTGGGTVPGTVTGLIEGLPENGIDVTPGDIIIQSVSPGLANPFDFMFPLDLNQYDPADYASIGGITTSDGQIQSCDISFENYQIYNPQQNQLGFTLISDFSALTLYGGQSTISSYNPTFAPSSLPEPGSASLLALAGLSLMARRRRSKSVPAEMGI